MPVDENDEVDVHIHFLVYDWLKKNKKDVVKLGLNSFVIASVKISKNKILKTWSNHTFNSILGY